MSEGQQAAAGGVIQPGSHSHGHVHDHGHVHGHGHGHGHAPRRGWRRLARPHSHAPADRADEALEASAAGLRVLWVSLAVLGVTAAAQAAITALSGSVALLGDALHNGADALTAVPLGIAFLAGRRPPSRRYTYGYGRAEDLAGVLVVAAIGASAAAAAVQAALRFAHPRPVTGLGAVALAAAAGCASNEAVARYRIRTGQAIGSAALVADGQHARADGLSSLAVLLAAGGSALGWRWADPVVGLLITVAILAAARPAARDVWRRLMDAVDPELVDAAEAALRGTPGVLGTGPVRLRWTGHRLRAECEILVDGAASAAAAHQVAGSAEHRLRHALPRLGSACVRPSPAAGPPEGPAPA